ncbi:hypothetical protein HPB51_011406 [Rhipicephalus microplus]|uniref:ZSWIM1/3 RNaseH-like domain-containing protein n=1 Tax=Rhipicephalus microplus TaxID=6941 RepID=A0A9J6F1G6_RHIMP|nr:hypothetical protein HPB51_011406 [Rhipicephalus microplus]
MSEPPDRQKVIEKYLQGLRNDDGYSHGYLNSDEELKLFERSLAAVNESQTTEGRLKADKAKEQQEALDAEQQTVAKETRVYVRIADCSSHQNYGFEDMEAFSQNMDKSVAERIQMLTREGITSVSDVKKCLHYYVHDVLFANKEKPDSSCWAFFPTHRDISNQIQAVLKKDRFSTVDQENARILIEKIRGEQPESSIVYRPYAARSFVGSSDSDNVDEGVASECEDTLLFCFQKKFMRNLLKKYGGSVVCLDATHTTSDYALPLFLLVVKTPSGYTPAGVFIIQFETAHCIAEALDVFKQWCDNWSPQYWMVDYSKTEISAIKQVFPESQISICHFHRLQAWQRLEFGVVLTTNNGIEAQNHVLKAQYVKSSSGKQSLISLIHGYLPDKEAKFHEAARRQSSAYRQYSENVPAYLHNRPHGFVKHMLRLLVNAEEYTPTDMEKLPVESGNDADAPDEFAAAFEYVSASQKKIGLFEDEEKSQDDESSLIADVTALNMLVRGAMCPTCRHLGLRVREPADKQKGLASFVELHCPNSECPETILSATYFAASSFKRGGQRERGGWRTDREENIRQRELAR